MPAPARTYPYRTPPNLVTLGPGNSFSIAKPPADFDLQSFTMSGDGGLVALAWQSGRIEVFGPSKGDAVRLFKAGVKPVYFMQFSPDSKSLLVTGDSDDIRFLDAATGKLQRTVRIQRGPRKYSIRAFAFGPDLSWLAYVNGENGKVLDLATSPPGVLAEFGDASALAASTDGSELWTVSRKLLARLDVATWKRSGEWPLPAPPVDTSEPSLTVGSAGPGRAVVAVPSKAGLIVYREPEVEAAFITNQATDAAWFSRSTGHLLNLAQFLSILRPDGSVVCERSYEREMSDLVTGDGNWLALQWGNSVRVWRIRDLLQECGQASGVPGGL